MQGADDGFQMRMPHRFCTFSVIGKYDCIIVAIDHESGHAIIFSVNQPPSVCASEQGISRAHGSASLNTGLDPFFVNGSGRIEVEDPHTDGRIRIEESQRNWLSAVTNGYDFAWFSLAIWSVQRTVKYPRVARQNRRR